MKRLYFVIFFTLLFFIGTNIVHASTVTFPPFSGTTASNYTPMTVTGPAWHKEGNVSGHDLYLNGGDGIELSGVFYGTDASFTYFSFSQQTLDITVDGVTSNLTLTDGALASSTIFHNLTDGAHYVTLKIFNSLYLDQDNPFSLTGNNPRIDLFPGTQYVLSNPTISNYFAIGDGLAPFSAGGYDYYSMTDGLYSSEGDFSFFGNPEILSVYTYCSGNVLNLSIDHAPESIQVTLPSDNKWHWITLATGLDSSRNHLYKINTVGNYAYFYAIKTIGGVLVDMSSLPQINRYIFMGTSITATISGLNTSGYVHQLENRLDISAANFGSGGDFLNDTISKTTRFSLIPPPKVVVIETGTNDMVGGGLSPDSTFKNEYINLLNILLASTTPNTKVFALGIIPRWSVASTTVDSWNGLGNGIQGAIATVNNSRISFIQTNTWNMAGETKSNYSMYYLDSVHPNQAGYQVMTNYLAPWFATTSYSVVGPVSASSLSTSTNFTVTAAGQGLFDGLESITISDGGNGGILTPSVGSSSVETVTVTPAASTTNFTFTYTPASAGTSTLTFTNGQSWMDSTPLTYFVSALPNTPAVETPSSSGRGSHRRITSSELQANTETNLITSLQQRLIEALRQLIILLSSGAPIQ